MANKPATLSPDDLAPDLGVPPMAERRNTEREHHGFRWNDPYAWLKDDSYPKVDDEDVLAYVRAENAYFEAAMKPHEQLTNTLFEELKGRIKEDDASVPVKDGEWLYQWRFEKGDQYRRWYRRPVGGGEEQLILDEPALADGLDFFKLGGMDISSDGSLLAWSYDDDGSERFTVKVKNLETGEISSDEIHKTIGSPLWAEDGATLLYLEVNDKWRPYRVRAHTLGSDPAKDPVIYEEADPSFFVGVHKTSSKAFIVIHSGDHVTNELRIIPAKTPLSEPQLIAEREAKREYELTHRGDQFFIKTNDTHANFRIVTAPVDAPQRANWTPVIDGTDEHYIRGITAFENFIVIQERVDGLDQLRLRYYEGEEHSIEFEEAAYSADLGSTPEFDSPTLRVHYESMVSPSTVYDYHWAEQRLETRKVQEIPSGYARTAYTTERLQVRARDGALVPVSIVYKKGFQKDGSRPVHLYAYGSYGHAIPPGFSSARLSLLDRGFAYAIAHIRGGDDLGYHWYESGKLFDRKNTFNDFVDVGRHLVAEGYASEGGISISGGSAGGELMGAVLNQAPELWRSCVAHVPFVDVLNTMLDDTLPLTPIEWPEWGNPIESKEAFEYIRSYSPYDNVEAKAYPPLMITAGINDPRVTYWEPAKWAAILRATKTDANVLLLKTNMEAGHGGKSGRFRRLRELAEEYTFILRSFGK